MAGQQQRLFDAADAPWEADDVEQQLVATVVLLTGPERPFDYLVPEPLRGELQAGCRVEVPFGRHNRHRIGYCVKLETRRTQPGRLKPVQSVLDHLLSPAMLRLTRQIADYTMTGWGRVLEAVVPAAVRGQAGTRRATVLSLAPDVKQNLLEQSLPDKQARVLQTLAGASAPITARELARRSGCTVGPIATLRKKGLIRAEVQRVQQFQPERTPAGRSEPLELNTDQQKALAVLQAAIQSGKHQTILIHGVTGSGKTEVYMQAIETVVGFGRQAIVLVPEISLTPQTKERFLARFGNVAVLHSHLSDGQRHWYWQEIAAGRVFVVVGARSAVFAPTPHLGLIVLDEEHETTFKQQSPPRYHARDVAAWRAQAESVPLVLGSATPSLESWYRAQRGDYRLVEMPRRVMDRPLPPVVTIDLREEVRDRHWSGAISRRLYQAMDAALRSGGQVILLLNRRGFSTHIQCPKCGLVVKCPECDVALTHHRAQQRALCHYCDYHTAAPAACPDCGYAGIRYGGRGTQRLEAEVQARFPKFRCLRMDTDSMTGQNSHEQALTAFRNGDVRILLGTQMIAKGLDFPNVTLVGVVNADTALHLPDFRAAERTFQLVTQVAGRTGRGEKGGRVLVQSFEPDHPALQAAARHDYRRFAGRELAIRRAHHYPPVTAMVRLVVRGPSEPVALGFAQHLGDRLRSAREEESVPARILGPAPAPLVKLRGNYRFHIQLQAPDGQALRDLVRHTVADLKPPENVQWIVDVDPLEMM